MAYIRYKEVTKRYHFLYALDVSTLPDYIYDYVFDDEEIIGAYKVGRDHGIFTTKKVILFDNSIKLRPSKIINVIPYSSIDAHSIMFYSKSVEIYLLMDNGHPLYMDFANTHSEEKTQIRSIFSIMSAVISHQEVPKKILEKIKKKDFKIKKED